MADEPYRRFASLAASAAFVTLAVILMWLSAGGWDLSGSKGTAMKSELCNHTRHLPDGRDLFQMVCAFGGTERAFSGIHDHKEFNGSGVYRCACCGAPLFPLDAKFNSGTGWPSFTAPVTDAMGYRKDILQYGSTEVHCSTCGAHLGHVFDDGPPPTGLRYCINSACLWYDEFASAIVAASSPWILNAYLVLLLLTGCCASCCVFSKHAVVVAQPYLQKPKADRVDVEATPVPRANAFADA
ncbi:unnamed protein product [Effrenium voratum]|uniref:Peptide-methionine (R)-S-oxide reductase n=1 Tax=Effrenium voratum TaxID=2562239 RepID=A0AA36MTG8_9DINO|nr:unnamed protein product [Effrenium voratum]CAJ1385275.1 unnamed protein product [Effrenium voratum]CAJ1413106.1 unnamed protein product [Effrenium voratum]